MPAGRTFLRIVDVDADLTEAGQARGKYRTVAYPSVPRRFFEEMVATGVDWSGGFDEYADGGTRRSVRYVHARDLDLALAQRRRIQEAISERYGSAAAEVRS